jgi:hypothetical protein
MKKLIFILLAASLLSGFYGCKKTAEREPDTELLIQHPPPEWKTDQSGKYPVSMTSVVSLPVKLKAGQSDGDKLAAFIDGECRGQGIGVQMDSLKVFFVLINGTSSEQSKITFRYFSKKTSYLYETVSTVNFKVDDNYGTAEKPVTLKLNPVR